MLHKLLLLASLVLVSHAAHADFTGNVISIKDGDTIEVLVDKKPIRIRLAQVDAPEKRQEFGTRSRQALSDLTYNRQVQVIEHGRDRYGRVLGTVVVRGVDVNRAMVAQGMAWAYRAYVKDLTLLEVERKARTARLGLWAHPAPVPPWEFRKQKPAR